MRTRSLKSIQALLLTLAMSSPTLLIRLHQDLVGKQNLSVQALPPKAFPLPTQATADFDGDFLPDRAELVSNGSQNIIYFTFSSFRVTSLQFSSETHLAGSIQAEDIDCDSDNDLVWVSNQQLTHTALWLNNGTGEFTRINEPNAYAVEIKRLVADKSGNGLLASPVSGRLRAIRTNLLPLLTRPENYPFEVPHFTSPPNSHCRYSTDLSPYLSRYPKRGPPRLSFPF